MTRSETCPVNGADREVMTEYWKEHAKAKEAAVEVMMLDSNAKVLDEMEKPEIVGMLPDFKDAHVLELASGIGRYTQVFASKASSVTAVEFMEKFHKQNVELTGQNNNVTHLCEDVMTLNQQLAAKDLIFSNWLLMYLGDEEVRLLADRMLKWTKPGGHVFFRESCFQRSGNMKRTSNPTHYRHPEFYIDAFRSVHIRNPDGSVSYFELVSSRSVEAYRKMKQNMGQICFLWRKATMSHMAPNMSFQQFLDQNQYSKTSIKRYEKIFGEGYVSTGGQMTTTELVSLLDLQHGHHVLDVGCGIGGGNFYMARQYGARVTGIDLSTNMIFMALETALKNPELDVVFEVCDATTRDYSPSSFDVVYSRDTILHIADKAALFQRFYNWLKPGGKLLISDYCRGPQEPTQRFKDYVKGRGYHLLTPPQYGKVLESVGFVNVRAEDRTEQFMNVLRDELTRTKSNRQKFIEETSEQDFSYIVNGWESKLVRCEDGDQKWGVFFAQKPL